MAVTLSMSQVEAALGKQCLAQHTYVQFTAVSTGSKIMDRFTHIYTLTDFSLPLSALLLNIGHL